MVFHSSGECLLRCPPLVDYGIISFVLFFSVGLFVLSGYVCFFLLLVELGNRLGQPWGFHLCARRRATALPFRRALITGDLGHAAAGEYRRVVLFDVVARDRGIVLLLDEQPLGALAPGTASAHGDERNVALQPLAVKANLEIAQIGRASCRERV